MTNEQVKATIATMQSMLNRQEPRYCNEIRLPSEKASALLAYIAELERRADEPSENRCGCSCHQSPELCMECCYGAPALNRKGDV